MKQTNKKILKAFYSIYFRSPSLKEFKACGGHPYINVEKYSHCYNKLLVDFGYPKTSKSETYDVVDIDNGKVVFTGTFKDIADEFGVAGSSLNKTYKNNWRFQCDYKIRLKPFDVELVKKEIKENG